MIKEKMSIKERKALRIELERLTDLVDAGLANIDDQKAYDQTRQKLYLNF